MYMHLEENINTIIHKSMFSENESMNLDVAEGSMLGVEGEITALRGTTH